MHRGDKPIKNQHIHRKKDGQIRRYLIPFLVFVAAAAAGLLFFFKGMSNSVDQYTRQTLKNHVAKQCEHMRSLLDIHYEYLSSVAEDVAAQEKLITEESMQTIASLSDHADIERVALMEPDGTAHYSDGTQKNVGYRDYFQKALSGERALSDPLESSVDQNIRIVLAVPVKKDGRVIGVLGGSYDVTSISHMLLNDLFDGEGYSLIVNEAGEIVAFDGTGAYRKLTYGDNFFDYYSEKVMTGNDSLEKVRKDFSNHHRGIILMQNPEDEKARQYMAYAPLGINNWMICYVLPEETAQESYSFIENYEVNLSIGFMAMVCVMLLYIGVFVTHRNMQLKRAAQTDALTGAYNKKNTEERINRLFHNPADKGRHAFLIIDVDNFKHINDTYGHAAGDSVLKEFGKLLQNYFRENDIVGRIGGDEFVVLMQGIEDIEVARERAGALGREVNTHAFPGYPERLSVSIGIALSPDCGKTYMDLYQCADHALYEVKQSGKNSCGICPDLKAAGK